MAGAGGDLERLMNLGPILAGRLRRIGVETAEDLRRLGAVDAYVRLKRAFPKETNDVTLYALHGSLTAVRWYDLSDEVRAALRHAAGRRL